MLAETLLKLCDDWKSDWCTMLALLNNPNSSKDVLEALASLPEDIEPRTILGSGGYDRNKIIRELAQQKLQMLAMNPEEESVEHKHSSPPLFATTGRSREILFDGHTVK